MANTLLQNMDLTYVRSEVKTSFPDTVSIQRVTRVSDKQGGFTLEWANAYQNVAARVIVNGGDESTDAAQQDQQIDATLTLAYDQSIEQTDRIVHSSGTYEIKFVDAGKTWAVSTRCQMRRI